MLQPNRTPALPGLDDKLIAKLFRALLLSPNPRRDRAILRIFLHFGCSVKDVLQLEESDVDLAAGRIRWRRGNGEFWTTLPAEVVRDIRNYCHRERRARCPQLFTTRLGHPLTQAQVQRLFRFLQKESGRSDLNPCTLRERHRQMQRQQADLPAWVALHRRLPYIPLPPSEPALEERER